jgi:flagella basal body P-ring formation protein FlgA
MAAFLIAAVAAAASVAAPVDVAVLAHTVERGAPLSGADFAVERRAPGLARGALPVAAAVGQEAARRLPGGSVVREGDLVRPQLVHRGEAVTIALRTEGLSITSRGRALSGGGVGDAVRVVSLASNRTLDATVEGSGRVRLMER